MGAMPSRTSGAGSATTQLDAKATTLATDAASAHTLEVADALELAGALELADARHRRRMRGLFALGVRSIGASERRVADLAGIDLRTIRSDRTSPSLACVGRVGALLGLPTATACAIVAAREGLEPGARLRASGTSDRRRPVPSTLAAMPSPAAGAADAVASAPCGRRHVVASSSSGTGRAPDSIMELVSDLAFSHASRHTAGSTPSLSPSLSPDLDRTRAPSPAANTDPILAALSRADTDDDLVALESLLEVLLRTGPRHAPKPADLGLALCVSARIAAARGETARVEPLLAVAARAGVPRRASPIARRLVRQARADLALGAPWLAAAASLTVASDRRGNAIPPATPRIPTRFLPTRLGRRPDGWQSIHLGSTVYPHRFPSDEQTLLEVARLALARLDEEALEVAPAAKRRPGRRSTRRAARLAAWSAATTGLLGVRVLEIATHRGAARATGLATTIVVRAQLALETMLATATGGLRTLVLSRAARLQIAEWALRMRLGEVRSDDLEPPERAELSALLHRFPAARGAIATAAHAAVRSSVRLAIGS